MSRRTGSAELPLHYGKVPAWLADRMVRLAQVISQAVVHHYGRDELLTRLSHPFWFQSFGAVMGMDWHSSGMTTSVLGALKRGLSPLRGELGIHVCGGRGRHSRQTPSELLKVSDLTGLDGERLVQSSRLVAKVDSAAIQDGFQLYLHSFIVADDGAWVVVQQGMHTGQRQARRYHWQSQGLTSFVDEPHAAIDGTSQGVILNLTDHRAQASRDAQVSLAGDPGTVLSTLRMPGHHAVQAADLDLKRLQATLSAAAAAGPADFPALLLTPGVGARTVQALALVAEVVHGAPSRFQDPARFALAHGGKDGHPFPVPLRVYDETLKVLREAVNQARLGNEERLGALQRLDREARRLEAVVEHGADFGALIARERAASTTWGGRTTGRSRTSEPSQAGPSKARPVQLSLFDQAPTGDL